MYARIIVDIAHANVDRCYTYTVPDGQSVCAGHRVLVPFGTSNKKTEGFVYELTEEAEPGVNCKSIISCLEPYPVMSDEQIKLALWIRNSYNCTLVEALRLMIPAQLRMGRVKEKQVRIFTLPDTGADEAREKLYKKDGTPKAKKQCEIYELLQKRGPMSAADISAYVDNASPALKALEEKGVVTEHGKTVMRDPFVCIPEEDDIRVELTQKQREACEAINAAIEACAGAFVLHGVTGSGKTEVYMHAIENVVSRGGTAIVLVPEISLTPQTTGRFRSRFGSCVAVLHSRLSPGERYDEWRRIRLGHVSVVVGARSAVFAPLDNLRLIVIDEEHEPSYQSGHTPYYNAIETAAYRCKLNGAVLVLGSATPSVATYFKTKQNRYTLLELPDRVRSLPMPKVQIADMRAEFAQGNNSMFSSKLYYQLEKCISAGEQAILFINRRGYSTFVSCRGCGYVITCPDCDVSMTYHKLEGVMKCHYCGRTQRIPDVCPECKKPYLKYFGIGTQQVEEQLKLKFPGVKALRMDMDTTRTKNAHYELLSRFISGEAQVLIGTQMIAKGLDIPNVTLVGVIAADSSLFIPDYRSCERTFQLLTQVAGRAGRDKLPGQVVIQTYSPEHPAIVMASHHDYAGFYAYEIAARRKSLFPPFTLFIRVLFIGSDEEMLSESAHRFCKGASDEVKKAITESGGKTEELLFAVDSPAPVRRRQGLYRYHVLMKLVRTKHTAKAIRAVYAYAGDHRLDCMSPVEINPADML